MKPLVRSRHRLEDIINLYHTEIGYEGVGWLNQAHDRDKWEAVVMTVMNFEVV
jgi:hypothetical protein